MDKELLERAHSAWIDQKIILEDSKDSGEEELIERAYRALFAVEEVLSKVFGLTDTDFERWGDNFWNNTDRWGIK